MQMTVTGITPACAGKSKLAINSVGIGADHPRMRGEKSVRVRLRGANEGSPPHARGKAICDSTDYPALGITPACAGKSPGIRPQSCR